MIAINSTRLNQGLELCKDPEKGFFFFFQIFFVCEVYLEIQVTDTRT